MILTRKDVVDAAYSSKFWSVELKASFLDKAAVLNGSRPYFFDDMLNEKTFMQIHYFFPIILSAAEAHFGIIYVYSSTSQLIAIL